MLFILYVSMDDATGSDNGASHLVPHFWERSMADSRGRAQTLDKKMAEFFLQ